ncbi:hypothetical protein GH714_040801 [Hevea brasiliensis]|uniref:CHY-type domain-containing protein n=1 Tax=Hevea brasiliensis TaxID=3981 RepID=A0A6A6MUN3_HEVBR|nr:hypothetical protein GH714_040801 [Hevea brasiliensis]
MGGGDDAPKCPPDKDYQAIMQPFLPVVEGELEPLFDVPLSDAPILFLVFFHKALRHELSDLHRLAVIASESVSSKRDVILDLRRRFDFFRLAHKYHSAVEDEVIFLALDAHTKNIVHKYALEHNCIDDLFDSVYHCLDTLVDVNKDSSETFQELISCIGTMHSYICQHMLKEEEQVFPLLLEHFSSKEQASLVWEFFCSIPVILLKELLPWMISFLSPEKQVDVTHCIREIVPQEKSLQEVVISWLCRNDRSSFGAFTKIRKEALDGCMESILKLHCSENPLREPRQLRKMGCVPTSIGNNMVEYLHLWHCAIQKDLKEILEEAYQRRNTRRLLNIDSLLAQLKFLVDVIIFYSNALKKFFYPVLNKVSDNHLSISSSDQFSIESHIGSLHQLLQYDTKNGLGLSQFVEKLCQELESFVMDIGKQFYFQEIEVFPLISKNCSDDTQRELLYTSLCLMPLGLLKCVIPWYAAHLSESESRSFLHGINQLGDNFADKSFVSVLLEWFHIGYSGKPSGNFGKNLQKISKSTCSFLPEQIKETIGCSSFYSNKQPCGESKPSITEPVTANKGKTLVSYSSSESHKAEAYEMPYASEINLHVFFPGTKRLLRSFPKLPGGESSAISITEEPKPMDLIFFFHKALKKDFEYLVSGSAQLVENIMFLKEFSQHFHLLWLRYQFHSGTEDEIAFPALEAKGKVQNISYSYTIDHKLEVKHFHEISLILDKMSKLHISVSSADSCLQDRRMVKYNQLCMKLHHMRMVEGHDTAHVAPESNTLWTADPLEIISRYLSTDALEEQGDILCDKGIKLDCFGANIDMLGKCNLDDNAKVSKGNQNNEGSKSEKLVSEIENKTCNEVAGVTIKVDKPGQPFQSNPKSGHHEHLLTTSQDDLEAAIRRVSRDSSLDPEKKSYIIQNLLMSRWIVQQRISHPQAIISSNGEEFPGQHPSYRDALKVTMGCKHYKRNCKLVISCCNKLYTCIRCHDEVADHSTDRRTITKMMCMKCLAIQPIGQTCSTVSCDNLPMARYYCKICKLFDDESTPVKALPCGHLMHSTCFQDYTCTQYTCPICSKSLGDMQVYFKMLDTLLAEEKMPDEYSGRTQVILCNDCEKKGAAPFHWRYHKCQYCGSYNTRLL